MMTIKLALDSPRGGKRARNMVEGEAAPGMHDQVVTIQRQAPAAEADAGARTNSKPNSSKYRGVTKHVRTGRWEAHIWCLNRQLYLGGFDTEGQAAIAYDLAAINIKGLDAAITNFDKSKYASQLGTIMKMKQEELVMTLRNMGKLKPVKAPKSKYKGIAKHASQRWEARISAGNRRYKYLGTYASEVEAAQVYDRAALARDVLNPTNFHISHYVSCLTHEQIQIAVEKGLLTEQQVAHVTPPDAAPMAVNAAVNTPAMQLNHAPTVLFTDDVLGQQPLRTTSIDAVLFAGGVFDFDCMVNDPQPGQPQPPAANTEGLCSVFGSGALHMSGALDDDVLLLDAVPQDGDDVALQLVGMQ